MADVCRASSAQRLKWAGRFLLLLLPFLDQLLFLLCMVLFRHNGIVMYFANSLVFLCILCFLFFSWNMRNTEKTLGTVTVYGCKYFPSLNPPFIFYPTLIELVCIVRFETNKPQDQISIR